MGDLNDPPGARSGFVSVDDHVVEPPDLWTRRLPRRYLDVAPRVSRERVTGVQSLVGLSSTGEERWCDVWRYESLAWPLDSSYGAVSIDRDEFRPGPITYDELRPGCYAVAARLEDMATNNMLASLCFPTFPRFCGQTFYEAKDKELALLCVRAYNDWMLEEWSAPSDGRLLPLTLIPLWDPEEAAREIRRTAARGAKAVAFSELPTRLGLPSIHDANGYWEPVFAACAETGSLLSIHIGSSSSMPSTSPDAPPPVNVTLVATNSAFALSDYLWSGVLERHPGLRILLAEAQAGWIPYLLERADKLWDAERAVSARGKTYHDAYGMTSAERPSFYYYNQVYSCLFDDDHALRNLDVVGEDNVLFEVDYPHIDSTWPNTHVVIERAAQLVTEPQLEKLLWRNAAHLFGLDVERLRSLAGVA